MNQSQAMERLKQSIDADMTKLDQVTKRFNEESGRLKSRLAANRKKLEELENAALLDDLHTISVSSGADIKEIVAAIRSGNPGRLNSLLQQMQTTIIRSDEHE